MQKCISSPIPVFSFNTLMDFFISNIPNYSEVEDLCFCFFPSTVNRTCSKAWAPRDLVAMIANGILERIQPINVLNRNKPMTAHLTPANSKSITSIAWLLYEMVCI